MSSVIVTAESTVDQSDSGDGWKERWSPLPTIIERAAADYRYSTESALHHRHQLVLGLSPGAFEIDTEMKKEGTATRTTTGR